MNTITQTVIAAAKSNHSILCWDGSNSKEDLLENIRHYVSNFTGWKLLSVEFDNNILTIATLKPSDDVETLLCYNVSTGVEIYGRLRHVGFYALHFAELKALLTAQ